MRSKAYTLQVFESGHPELRSRATASRRDAIRTSCARHVDRAAQVAKPRTRTFLFSLITLSKFADVRVTTLPSSNTSGLASSSSSKYSSPSSCSAARANSNVEDINTAISSSKNDLPSIVTSYTTIGLQLGPKEPKMLSHLSNRPCVNAAETYIHPSIMIR